MAADMPASIAIALNTSAKGAGRKLWKAAKKRIEIDSFPSRFYSLSSKPKGKHHKKYARLVAEIQHLEQQTKHSRIKDFDIKSLAYHLQ
jgi:hypothetical protein